MTDLLTCQHTLLNALWAQPGAVTEISKYIANSSIKSSGEVLKIYQSNAGAGAQRALQAAYPVVTALLSEDSMGQLARALWFAHPPARGDLACWGGELADFIAHCGQLDELPWLPDLARLEWAVHQAHTAAEVWLPSPAGSEGSTPYLGLAELVHADPATHTLVLAAATRTLRLDWAVHAIWQAHQLPEGAERDAAVAELAAAHGSAAQWATRTAQWVCLWRPQHRVQCEPMPLASRLSAAETHVAIGPAAGADTEADLEATWLALLGQGASLLTALEVADPGLATWLPHAAASGLVRGLRPLNPTGAPT